jgi:hypothetical protein
MRHTPFPDVVGGRHAGHNETRPLQSAISLTALLLYCLKTDGSVTDRVMDHG